MRAFWKKTQISALNSYSQAAFQEHHKTYVNGKVWWPKKRNQLPTNSFSKYLFFRFYITIFCSSCHWPQTTPTASWSYPRGPQRKWQRLRGLFVEGQSPQQQGLLDQPKPGSEILVICTVFDYTQKWKIHRIIFCIVNTFYWGKWGGIYTPWWELTRCFRCLFAYNLDILFHIVLSPTMSSWLCERQFRSI